jgi:hypothetical protein
MSNPPVRTVAQITREALSAPAGIAYGIVRGRVVEAWSDLAVIEAWANGEPAPDDGWRAIRVACPGGRMVLLAPVPPPSPPAPFEASQWL